jgi:16S rRNA (adenine1518-N6/adenine1519-N6)-dimethyltransferase
VSDSDAAAPRPLTASQLRKLFDRYGFRPRRSLGQTFLTDLNIVRKILQIAEVGPDDAVLEIGPGAGTVTRALAAAAQRVVAIEVDPTLVAILHETVGEGAEVIHQDVLAVDWPALLPRPGTGRWKVVANLPYAITGPAILKLLDAKEWIERLVIMVQVEVAERLVAAPGSRAHGLLSVLVQAACEAKLAWRVPRTCFRPVPGVDSGLVLLTVRRPALVAADLEPVFRRVVKGAFSARRKVLANSFAQASDLRLGKEEAAALLTACDIAPGCRAEELSVEQFLCLARRYAARTGGTS